ncbi:MAG: hypothetical protein IIC83_12600, partial [Chloroflexi bacterium]|nr:hypothetical protein [Chloroflexota bacterium]
QLKRGSDGVAGLDELKLEGVEPAVSFRADGPDIPHTNGPRFQEGA